MAGCFLCWVDPSYEAFNVMHKGNGSRFSFDLLRDGHSSKTLDYRGLVSKEQGCSDENE